MTSNQPHCTPRASLLEQLRAKEERDFRRLEADIMDLTIDLNAVSIDAEVPLSELDESGIERVPMADPGMDVSALTYDYEDSS